MDSDLLTHSGLAIIGAVIILREILPFFVKSTKNTNGNGSVTRTEYEEHKKTVQYKDNCKAVVEGVKTHIVSLRERHEDLAKNIQVQLEEVKSLIRNGNK